MIDEYISNTLLKIKELAYVLNVPVKDIFDTFDGYSVFDSYDTVNGMLVLINKYIPFIEVLEFTGEELLECSNIFVDIIKEECEYIDNDYSYAILRVIGDEAKAYLKGKYRFKSIGSELIYLGAICLDTEREMESYNSSYYYMDFESSTLSELLDISKELDVYLSSSDKL